MNFDNYIVNKIIKYIEINITNTNIIDGLQIELGYTNRHIRRLFKEYTQVSLYKYITYRKCVWALNDIKHSDLLMQEISLKYGYVNNDSFIRMFRGVFGLSPKKSINLKYELLYKNIVDNITAPYIIGSDFIEYKTSRRNYKDLYWNKSSNKLSSYIVSINNSHADLITSLKEDGFGAHYITNINDDNINVNITNKPQCEITLYSIIFICYKNIDLIIKNSLIKHLNYNNIIIELDYENFDLTNEYIYSIISILNDKNLNMDFIKALTKIDYLNTRLKIIVKDLNDLNEIKIPEQSVLLVKDQYIESSKLVKPLNYRVFVDCSIKKNYQIISFVIKDGDKHE